MALRRIGPSRPRPKAKPLSVRKGDTVVVISGKDRGKRGRVLRVEPRTGRVVVEGVNVVRRHTRPNPPKVLQGGIVEKEAPIDRSNVMVVCRNCHEPTRVGTAVLEDGTRVRRCRRCGEAL
ncbi:MAG: 50S ribosomal protein L24 [Clostridia bacterium]|nr:50S ribosomal protein L24 [Clostridia bacterium]